MILDLIDYIIGEIKMLLYKLVYFNRLKYHIYSRFSRSFQLRIRKNGKLYLGKNVGFRPGVKISIGSNAKLYIGDNSWFNSGCMLTCAETIEIGEHVLVGQNVMIYDHNHRYTSKESIDKQGLDKGAITIKDNVWIGSGCIILQGVVIGANSVIAAGTIVKENVPANSLVYNKREDVVCEIMR